ncbi:MAG: 50S ribosomal protein L15 [Alphaproteobacteria bacterium]|nr:50S ribosomal protein L15 [Alphaproteobacteria bacterium]
MKLNQLSDNAGSRKSIMRVGRGIGSGKGKTAGRGGKGQTARTGVAINGFEGGQMPIYMRMPKRGFNNIFSKNLSVVKLGRIQQALDNGKLDASKVITEQSLKEAGIIKKIRDGVKILLGGDFKTKNINFSVYEASASALKHIEKLGGKIDIVSKKS